MAPPATAKECIKRVGEVGDLIQAETDPEAKKKLCDEAVELLHKLPELNGGVR